MTKSDMIYNFVNEKIGILQTGSPWSKAMLAKLRRGVGKEPSESYETWEITLNGIPEELTGFEGVGDFEANEAEMAIHVALTLYALHQQGNSLPVNSYNKSFAASIRSLINTDKSNEDAIKRRFDAIITSDTLMELSTHARGLVQLMKASENTSFNYPLFAKDLYFFQYPEGKKTVRLRWGLDFYKVRMNEPMKKEEEE
ncbi:MAG: type I-E CRISPR-associated protein Cse2/CasB [Candidatus Methanomethylophilaceae archaeon]